MPQSKKFGSNFSSLIVALFFLLIFFLFSSSFFLFFLFARQKGNNSTLVEEVSPYANSGPQLVPRRNSHNLTFDNPVYDPAVHHRTYEEPDALFSHSQA